MSWLCVVTLSCLANPAAPVALPPTLEIAAPEISLPQAAEPIPVAAHARPAAPSAERFAPGSTASPPLVSCELRRVRRGGAQVVLAVVRASASAEGAYEFSVDARDAGRNVVSSSTGDGFQVRAGERLGVVSKEVVLGQSADGRLSTEG